MFVVDFFLCPGIKTFKRLFNKCQNNIFVSYHAQAGLYKIKSILSHMVKLSHIESGKGLCLVGDASSIGMRVVCSKRSMTTRNQFLSI